MGVERQERGEGGAAMTELDLATPFAIWCVAMRGAAVTASLIRAGRGPGDAGGCVERYFMPAAADDEEAARRMDLLRSLDCLCDPPTYAPGEVPVRLRGTDI